MNLILTSTTYFRRNFGITEFIQNLRSLYMHNTQLKTAKVVVVNEFSENQIKEERGNQELLNKTFPGIKFIQKDKPQFGQANSLNILLRELDGADFQLHWEEGWECTRSFLDDALVVMEKSTLSQLNVTADFLEPEYCLGAPQTIDGVPFQPNTPHPEFETLDTSHYLEETREKVLLARLSRYPEHLWPLYSLRPAINRVSFIKNLPQFATSNKLWPWRFELLYAMHWHKSGGSKATLLPAAAIYSANYASTHRNRPFGSNG